MRVRTFRCFNAEGRVEIQGPLATHSGWFTQEDHGIYYRNESGVLISMIPWSQIIEVWY